MPLRRETSLDKEEFSASKPTPLDKASIKDLIYSMRRNVREMDTFGVAARLILHKGVEIVRWTYCWRCWMHRWIYIILLGFYTVPDDTVCQICVWFMLDFIACMGQLNQDRLLFM